MMRAPYERLVLEQRGNVIGFIAAKWQQQQNGQETFDNAEDADARYEEIKMIAAVDYQFSVVMENIDAE
jgi:hypothetical protein